MANVITAWENGVNAKLDNKQLVWCTMAPVTMMGKLRMASRGSTHTTVSLNGGVILRASSVYAGGSRGQIRVVLTPVPPIDAGIANIRHFEVDEGSIAGVFGPQAKLEFDQLLMSDDLEAMTKIAEKEREAERRKAMGAKIGETAGFGDW